MPFTKTGPNQYTSPSGRNFNLNQVRMYYARGGNFPGQKGMGDQLGPSLIRSPTAPGKAKSPTLSPSGKTNAATSPVPTSILNGGKQTFGPLAYSGTNAESAEMLAGRTAERERKRASREYRRK
jgi:hypothetical protein